MGAADRLVALGVVLLTDYGGLLMVVCCLFGWLFIWRNGLRFCLGWVWVVLLWCGCTC